MYSNKEYVIPHNVLLYCRSSPLDLRGENHIKDPYP